MKMHDEIRNKEANDFTMIYDAHKARRLFEEGKHTPRQLSIMKQENIRIALKTRGFTIGDIRDALDETCGYCFAYFNLFGSCVNCPLYKRVKEDCIELPEWKSMHRAKTKEEFLKAHIAWCRRLGLEKDMFKEVMKDG